MGSVHTFTFIDTYFTLHLHVSLQPTCKKWRIFYCKCTCLKMISKMVIWLIWQNISCSKYEKHIFAKIVITVRNRQSKYKAKSKVVVFLTTFIECFQCFLIILAFLCGWVKAICIYLNRWICDYEHKCIHVNGALIFMAFFCKNKFYRKSKRGCNPASPWEINNTGNAFLLLPFLWN